VFPPSSERIINVVYPRREDISQSNAQILGDDGVLLKYINPHVVGVFSTTEEGESSTLHVSIVDTVACRLLYRTVHHSAEGPVKGLFIENWLIYSYFNVKVREALLCRSWFGWPIYSRTTIETTRRSALSLES
jgi:hypothetical protein